MEVERRRRGGAVFCESGRVEHVPAAGVRGVAVVHSSRAKPGATTPSPAGRYQTPPAAGWYLQVSHLCGLSPAASIHTAELLRRSAAARGAGMPRIPTRGCRQIPSLLPLRANDFHPSISCLLCFANWQIRGRRMGNERITSAASLTSFRLVLERS
nr:uncharacterized protein LOC127304616 [Lolium perenne]